MTFTNLLILTGHRKSGTTVFSKLFQGHPEIYTYPTDISVLYAYFPHFTNIWKNDEHKLRNRLNLVLKKSLSLATKDMDIKESLIDAFIKGVNSSLSSKDLTNRNAIINAIAYNWIKNYYRTQETRLFVIKETSQSIYLDILLKENNQMKMLNLIRDPRDNYAALKSGVEKYYSKLGENEKDVLASLITRARIDLVSAKNNVIAYPNSYRAVKFENLIKDPLEEMKSLAKFIGISFDPILCTPTVKKNIEYKGNSFDDIEFSGLENKNIGRWQQRISEEEAKIIEFFLSDVMEYWGYDFNYPNQASQEAASKFYSWFNSKYFFKDSFK